MRIAVDASAGRPTCASSSATRSRRPPRPPMPCDARAARRGWCRRSWRGLSEPIRVLEDHLHVAAERPAARAGRSASDPGRRADEPADRGDQAAGSACPSVDLPQPHSPTRPSVSPAASAKLTPSTARTRTAARRRVAGLRGHVDRQQRHACGTRASATRQATQWPCRGRDDAERRRRAARRRSTRRAARRECAATAHRRQRRRRCPGLRRAARRRAVARRDGIAPSRPARVGMLRLGEERDRRGLHDLAAGIHHDDAVRDLGDDAEIMGDEDQRPCGARAAARRSRSRICAWMVTSSAVVGSSAISSLRAAGERHGDHHALAHAAGQLVRIVVDAALRRRECARAPAARSRARARPAARARLVRRSASTICSPTVSTGLSEVIGSWKIIAISLAAHLAHPRSASAARSRPSKRTCAADDPRRRPGSRRMIASAVTRLAAAGFADDRHGLAGRTVERQPVDRRHTPRRVEAKPRLVRSRTSSSRLREHGQRLMPAILQSRIERVVQRHRRRELSASTVSTIATPGHGQMYQACGAARGRAPIMLPQLIDVGIAEAEETTAPIQSGSAVATSTEAVHDERRQRVGQDLAQE